MKYFKRFLILLLTFTLIIGGTSLLIVINLHNKYNQGIPVLGYHGVVSNQDKTKYFKTNQYVFSQSELEKQFKYLKANNYQTLSMDELYEYYKSGKKPSDKCVALTFDDGFKNYKTVVEPLLKKYNFKATCFVITSKLEKKNSTKKGDYTYLEKNDLDNNKFSMYCSHTYDMHHKNNGEAYLEFKSAKEINNDIKKASEYVNTDYLAYPYGISSETVRDVLKTNKVKLAFSYNQVYDMNNKQNQYLLPRYLMFSKMPFTYFKWIVD